MILLLILIVLTFDNKVLGQRTQYDIDREESLRRQRPSVSNIFAHSVSSELIFFLLMVTPKRFGKTILNFVAATNRGKERYRTISIQSW